MAIIIESSHFYFSDEDFDYGDDYGGFLINYSF